MGGIIMKRLGTNCGCKLITDTVAKIEGMSHDEQRRLASVSKDEMILNVLSGFNDFHIALNIIHNKNAPASALKTIVRNKSSQFVSQLLLRIVRHPNLDAELFKMMAQQKDWSVRYAVAMKEDTPSEMLGKLAGDENLAVRAMAARRLKLPLPDDEMGVEISCRAMNKTFEKMREAMNHVKTLSEAAASRIRFGNDGYGPFSQFLSKCEMELEDLRDDLTYQYAAMILSKRIPDKHVDCGDLPKLMQMFGDDYFDAYIIAAKLKVPITKPEATIMRSLRERASSLIPIIGASGSAEAGAVASKAEQIQKGNNLLLKAPAFPINCTPYPDIGTMHALEALDKISKVILASADPNKVESHVMERLVWPSASNPTRVGVDVSDTTELEAYIDDPILSLRFLSNGRLEAKYLTEEEARKVANFLVSLPDETESYHDSEEMLIE